MINDPERDLRRAMQRARMKYKLEGKEVVPIEPVPGKELETLLEWAKCFESKNRIIDQTVVRRWPRIFVSTVFLGIDHSFGIDEPPLLFETMIFGGEHSNYQTKCAEWDEAEQEHEKAVDLARKGTLWNRILSFFFSPRTKKKERTKPI